VTEGGARRLIHGLVKLTQFCVSFIVLWSQNGSFETPQSCQFLNRSLFWFYGHKSWVMAEKISSQVQAADIGFLPRVHGVTLRGKVRNPQSPECRTTSSESRGPSYVGSSMCPECPTKDWRGTSCWLSPRESGPEVVQGPGGVTTSPTLLGPVLVWSQQSYLKSLLTVRHFESS